MANRKPLHDDCTGGIDCPVPDHVLSAQKGRRWKIFHAYLTPGQKLTLVERRNARSVAARG